MAIMLLGTNGNAPFTSLGVCSGLIFLCSLDNAAQRGCARTDIAFPFYAMLFQCPKIRLGLGGRRAGWSWF